MIVGNRHSLNRTLEKRAAKRSFKLAYGQNVNQAFINNIQTELQKEDKRIAITKSALNFWGVFLCQGAISITIIGLIIWGQKNFSYTEENGYQLSITNTELFFYGFLLIFQYLLFVQNMMWRNQHSLNLIHKGINDIRQPFISGKWKKDEEWKMLLSLIIGASMLFFSIYLLQIFIK